MSYKHVTPPAGGKISIQSGKLNVPDNPVLPFIRGDGTGGPPIPPQDASQVAANWAAGPIDVRMGPYLSQAQQKWSITPAAGGGRRS